MNYKKIYDNLILKRQKILFEGKTEIHHIIPRSIGGNDDKNNLVNLSLREHFVAHQLLTKIYKNNKGLAWAAFSMAQQRKYNSRKYSWLKENHLSKPLSEETKKKLSEKAKNRTDEMKKKTSEEMKKIWANRSSDDYIKIFAHRRGKKLSEEHKKKVSENHVGMIGKKHSDFTKKKMSESRKKYYQLKRESFK